MAKGDDSRVVLLLDDEPEYLTWVEEFLKRKGLSAEFVRTLAQARAALGKRDYRLLLIDMNVPADPNVSDALRRRFPLVDKYSGLTLAIEARNRGYGAHSVIGYTVHDDEEIAAALGNLNSRYVLKGRPQVLKNVIESSLAGRITD